MEISILDEQLPFEALLFSKRISSRKCKTIDLVFYKSKDSIFYMIRKTYSRLDSEVPQSFAPNFDNTITTFRTLVSRQVDLLPNLHHPNINRLLKASHDVNEVSLFFEDGGSCLMDRKPDGFYSSPQRHYLENFNESDKILYVFKEQAAKEIFLQLAKAVMYIHSKNICHCDIKPSNIVIKEVDLKLIEPINLKETGGEWNKKNDSKSSQDTKLIKVQLIDFENYHNASLGKAPCGGTTKAFLPPEAIGQPACDGFSLDIWSLGCVFYILLTGMHPIFHHEYNLISFYYDSTSENNKPISFDYHKFVSSQAQSLIRGMLDPSPKNRFTINQIISHEWFNFDENNN